MYQIHCHRPPPSPDDDNVTEVLDAATLLFGTSLVFIVQICPPPMTPGGAASGGTFDDGVSFFCFCFFSTSNGRRA
jgi:hypothetical protein